MDGSPQEPRERLGWGSHSRTCRTGQGHKLRVTENTINDAQRAWPAHDVYWLPTMLVFWVAGRRLRSSIVPRLLAGIGQK